MSARWRVGCRGLAVLGIWGVAMAALAEPPADLCPTRIHFAGSRFDLERPEDLRRLAAALDGEIHDDERADALVAMRSFVARALAAEGARCEALVGIAEIGDSLILKTKFPTPRRADVVQVPFLYFDLMSNPVGKGKTPAANLRPSAASSPDSSLRDPVASTFWSRPKDVASRDLYREFGPILTVENEVCVYDEPKTSYGTTPGFSMRCGEKIIKVKFGENENQKRDTEVAVTRLYGALGFHVEPNDYAPEIRLAYDRRLLLEFNSRKDLTFTITALGFIPIYRKRVQTTQDPFRYIRSAVLKEGTVLSAEALARRLIRPEILQRSARAARRHPKGTSPEHYRADAALFERTLDHLVLEEANIQARDSGGKNIGPWAWDRLDHSGKRELRGAGLLFAWVNCFDARWDNNRLKLVDGGGGAQLRHVISDLGNALGLADNFKVVAQGLVNDFPWTFTEAPVIDRKGRQRKPFRIVRYQPIFDNGAFRAMTVDDARWMARLIAQLTENQLEQALIAAGYTSAEVRLYTEKLVSRRDRMIQDLGLAGEIRLLRPRGVIRTFDLEIEPLEPGGIVRTFDYDPRKDGPVIARAGDGSELSPRESRDLVVRHGRVEPR